MIIFIIFNRLIEIAANYQMFKRFSILQVIVFGFGIFNLLAFENLYESIAGVFVAKGATVNVFIILRREVTAD